MNRKSNLKSLLLVFGILAVVVTAQFILARKQLLYGFFIDDWDNLSAYKLFISNPILDIPFAWKALGSHRFAHVYYIGVLFEFFKYNYLYYNITNQLLKAFSAFALFPVVYLLFKNKLLAFLATFLYVTHFSPYGALDDVSRGGDFLVVLSMNIFLTLYIYSFRKHSFNLKTLFTLLILLLATVVFDPSRSYPLVLLLPLLELLNFWLNRSSTNLKASLLRLVFLYSPFIAIFFFSPGSVLGPSGYYIGLWEKLKLGNFQLFLAPFASFGSTFIPKDLMTLLFGNPYYQSMLYGMLIIFGILYIVIGFFISSSPSRFIKRAMLTSICFSILAFMAANQWQHLDVKLRASVDPSTFLIPALIGLFILSSAISFFREWLDNRKNTLLLGLSLAPIISFLYIFMTWVLTDVNSIFMGVHAYLNIPAIGVSIYLAIILYLVYQKLYNSHLRMRRIIASLVLIGFILIYFKISSQALDQYFSYWLKNGFDASDQERMRNTFWKEVGYKKFTYQNPGLIFLDSFQDYDNGMYYENGFVWRIPAYFMVETGQTLPACDLMMYKEELNKLRIENRNGKKVVVQERCGYAMAYQLENFYSFKLINREIIPNKSEILKKLGVE